MVVALLLASLVPGVRGKTGSHHHHPPSSMCPHTAASLTLLSPPLLPFFAAGAITYATNGEQTMKAHFSDFYEIMQPEDYT